MQWRQRTFLHHRATIQQCIFSHNMDRSAWKIRNLKTSCPQICVRPLVQNLAPANGEKTAASCGISFMYGSSEWLVTWFVYRACLFVCSFLLDCLLLFIWGHMLLTWKKPSGHKLLNQNRQSPPKSSPCLKSSEWTACNAHAWRIIKRNPSKIKRPLKGFVHVPSRGTLRINIYNM